MPWSRARLLCRSGRVRVDGNAVVDPGAPVGVGAIVDVNPSAPTQRANELPAHVILHVDAHVVVVDKPAGWASVPATPGDRDSLLDRVQASLRKRLPRGSRHGAATLRVVQRLDKDTSGVMVFARTRMAERVLQQQFRKHSVERRYLAIVYGSADPARCESHFVENRGDGLRGSVGRFRRHVGPIPEHARRAVTHVHVVERLHSATLVACTLETGRQHQIRIHLSEAGHPIVGEPVYIREFRGQATPTTRLMLHAELLGFVHPATEQPVRFSLDPPSDFLSVLARLRPT